MKQRSGLKCRGQVAVNRSGAKRLSLAQKHDAITGLAEAGRVRQHRLEHGFKLPGRAGARVPGHAG